MVFDDIVIVEIIIVIVINHIIIIAIVDRRLSCLANLIFSMFNISYLYYRVQTNFILFVLSWVQSAITTLLTTELHADTDTSSHSSITSSTG